MFSGSGIQLSLIVNSYPLPPLVNVEIADWVFPFQDGLWDAPILAEKFENANIPFISLIKLLIFRL